MNQFCRGEILPIAHQEDFISSAWVLDARDNEIGEIPQSYKAATVMDRS